jgi:hypothetical protein
MAGILAVYSLVIAVLLSGDINPPDSAGKITYSLFRYVGRLGLGRSEEMCRPFAKSGTIGHLCIWGRAYLLALRDLLQVMQLAL